MAKFIVLVTGVLAEVNGVRSNGRAKLSLAIELESDDAAGAWAQLVGVKGVVAVKPDKDGKGGVAAVEAIPSVLLGGGTIEPGDSRLAASKFRLFDGETEIDFEEAVAAVDAANDKLDDDAQAVIDARRTKRAEAVAAKRLQR